MAEAADRDLWVVSSDEDDEEIRQVFGAREKTPMPNSDDSESDWSQPKTRPLQEAPLPKETLPPSDRRGTGPPAGHPVKVQKRRLEVEEVFSSSEESSPGEDEEEEEAETDRSGMVKDSAPKTTSKKMASSSDDHENAEPAMVDSKKKRSAKSAGAAPSKKPRKEPQEREEIDGKKSELDVESDEELERPLSDPVEYGAQKAMKILTTICDRLDIRWQGSTIRPDDAIWTRIGGTFVRKRHPEFRLTFSSFDSFHNQVGRFLAAMVYGMAELEPKFVPGGAHVWRHGWEASTNTTPKCLHGNAMFLKPRTVELNPTSEAGKRAIAEQNGQIEKNRFGKQVVVLRFDRNAVCSRDADHSGFPYPHVIGSCGMAFSDAAKAVSAMRHDLEWTKALYPNAEKRRAEEHILISTNCNCNYAVQGPISGRQVCRMIPYKLSGTDDIASDTARSRPDMKAHKKYPHTMVYTCCNPQSPSGTDGPTSRSGRKTSDKTCAWRLSAMDLRHAYVFATELVLNAMGVQAPTHVPEFRWHERFGFKTEVIAPVKPVETGDPFA
ncbi:DNA-binding protein [Fowl aviadenovirus D]|uniref:DNA-binding protein n=1 Tax=Fowl aviadenovirus D TaxID=190064 RepID=A0A650C0S5_9ADEN|nr:DNA-binding protein [Fowl aviadenovirus D]